jgi:hypothetical protein
LNKHFTKEYIQMTSKQKYPKSLVLNGMQIKTVMTYTADTLGWLSFGRKKTTNPCNALQFPNCRVTAPFIHF